MIRRYVKGKAEKAEATTKEQLQSDKWGKSVTDKSQYRPEASLRRAEAGLQTQVTQGLYDYYSEEETNEGAKDFMAYLRRKDLDITEVNQIKEALEKHVENMAKKAQKEIEAQEAAAKGAEETETRGEK